MHENAKGELDSSSNQQHSESADDHYPTIEDPYAALDRCG
jgi:hypothetical protein